MDFILAANPSGTTSFGLFEPCHGFDRVHFANCSEEMASIMNCDFDRVEHFQMWNNFLHGKEAYSPEVARRQCEPATTRVFKTISTHDIENDLDIVFAHVPNLRVVNIVRDPRATYFSASAATGMVAGTLNDVTGVNQGYGQLRGTSRSEWSPLGPKYISYLCTSLVKMSKFQHDGVISVRFEDLILKSSSEVPRILDFLQMDWDSRVQELAAQTYPAVLDGAEGIREINHLDTNWTEEDRAVFKSAECQEALQAWNYPLD